MRRSNPPSRALSTRDDRPDDKRGCCCHPCLVILLMIGLVGVGGILIWRLLPEDRKNSIKGVVDSGVSGMADSGDGSLGEPPTFDFYRCTDQDNCCNGVDSICDLSISNVMFAGLHNAMSSVEDGFLIAGNHEYQLESALQAGFRGINIDVGNCGGDIVLVHTKCSLGTRDPYLVFGNIHLFLDKHPRDIILMPLQINNDVDQTVDLYELYSILQSIPGFTERMYIHTRDTTWPTMRELIENDTRIIVFIYNAGTNCSDGDCPPGFHPYFLYATETLYTFKTVQDVEILQSSCQLDRGAEGYRDFYVVNSFVTDPLPSKASSQVINQSPFLRNHIKACEQVAQSEVNMVFIDFWEEGDLVDVVQTHNQQLGAQRRRLRTVSDALP